MLHPRPDSPEGVLQGTQMWQVSTTPTDQIRCSIFNAPLFSTSVFSGENFIHPTVAPKPVKDVQCLPSYGVDYTGNLDVTLGGHTCLRWSSPQAVALSRDKEFIPEVTLDGNKCRNPDNDPEGPWCYVEVSGNVTVDYCALELCGKEANHSVTALHR